MKRFVYADNAATTKLDGAVLEAMLPYLTEQYGNPSSIYALGQNAARAIRAARERVAFELGAKPEEIYFTGGGSESDTWAIRSAAALSNRGKHIITSVIEHHAVLHAVEALEREGFEATYLGVDRDGLVSPDELSAAIRPDTALITIMTANNEIGVIQPIAELSAIAREHGVPFHTDAVQAVGHIPVNVDALGVDMLSLAAHKFHGPKGVGALYVRRGMRLQNLIYGGGQERGKRAGTENTAGIVGLAKALALANEDLEEKMRVTTAMRDRLIDGILGSIPYSRLNGSRERRLPGNVNVSIEFIEGESLILRLDEQGIAASSGSACTSGSLDPSHVLLGIGLSHEVAHGSLRLSLDHFNTDEDVDYILETLPGVVAELREMSPLWEHADKEGVDNAV